LPPTCAAMISAVVGAAPGSVVWGRVASIVIAGRSFDAGGRGRYSKRPLAGAPEARGCKPDAVPDGPSGRGRGMSRPGGGGAVGYCAELYPVAASGSL